MPSRPNPGEGKHARPPHGKTSGKDQLLATLEVLRAQTDPRNGLSARRIAEEVGRICGSVPSDAKVLDDAHAIARAKPFGMEIEFPERGRATGIRRTKGALSSAQARALINMARTCKFVSSTQRDELCEALGALVSESERGEIVRGVHVDERDLPSSPDAYLAADVASKAIKEGHMVRFDYATRLLDGTESLGDGTCCEIPVALVFSFGRYYLETVAPGDLKGGTLMRRLDKVRNPRPAGRWKDDGTISELRRTVGERAATRVDMWGSGPRLTLFLRVKASHADYVYDRFGATVKFEHVAKDGSVGYVCIAVQASPTLCRWLFGMGEGIAAVKPKDHLWASQFWNGAPAAAKPFDALLADYDEFRRAMESLLATCSALYGISSSGVATQV